MRVIAGGARGRRLKSLAGEGTRPTSDRVKEALFSALAPRLAEARVLDVFAGSGALAIEALSRGAASAVLVDKERRSIGVIGENLALAGFSGRAEVRCESWQTALAHLQAEEGAFDIVFVDPPYQSGYYAMVLDTLFQTGLVQPGGIVVCEHDAKTELPDKPGVYGLVKTRRYGHTALTFFTGEEKSL